MHNWKIKDLQGVGDVELNLDDNKRVFVLFGSNGVGKTKTLEALFLFTLGKSSSFNKEFHIPFPFISGIQKQNHCFELEGKVIHLANLQKQLKQTENLAFAYLGSSQRCRVTEPTNTVQQIGTILDRQKAHYKVIAKAFNNGSLTNLGGLAYLNEWFVARAQATNDFQKESIKSKNEIYTVLNSLNKIDSRIEKTMQIDGSNNVYLNIEGEERKLTELSSGFISIVKIIQTIVSSFALFTEDDNLLDIEGIVFIDEIESHLHVEWQTKIIPTLKNLFPNTTFYIATHSPLVLSQLDEGEAYLLKRDKDGVVRSQMVDSPNKRILANVLRDTFGIDLNQLKRQSMETSDQSQAKAKLLALLDDDEDANNGGTVARGNDE